MFVDARTLSVDESLASDICIVGSGMAGIAIATALSGTGRRVLLVESGGFDSDPATQSLNDGESVGLGYRINESRIRYFGGSGNEWAGNCRELDAANFKHRRWVPHSGWPCPGPNRLKPPFGRCHRSSRSARDFVPGLRMLPALRCC